MSKKLLAFLLVVVVQGTVLCNYVSANPKLDSLKTELHHAKTDQEKIGLMIELSLNSLANNLPDSAQAWAERANALSQKLSYGIGLAESIYQLGEVAASISDTEAAFAHYRQAIEIGTKANAELVVGKAHSSMASIFYGEDNFPAARIHYQRALEKYTALNELARMGATEYNIGNVDYHNHNYEDALVQYYQALETYQHAGYDKGQAQTKLDIGSIYLMLGDRKNARHYLQEGLDEFSKLADQTGMAKAYGYLANFFTHEGDFANALAYIEKVLAIQERIGAPKTHICSSIVRMGMIYTEMGEYDKALTYFEECQSLAIEIGSKYYQLEALTWLADTYFKTKQYGQARELAAQSIALGKELDRPLRIKEDYQTLYKVDSALGDFDRAFANYQEYIQYKEALDSEDAEKVALRYEYEKQEKESALLVQKQKMQQNMAWAGVGAVVLVAGGLGLYSRSRTRHRIEMDRIKFQSVKETERLKSRFFANISHEFRTPLTLINGHLENLKEEQDGQQLLVYTEMEQQSKQLLDLVNQLLEVSKRESGYYELQYRQGDILCEISAYVQAFHSHAVRQGITLDYTVSEAAKTTLADGRFGYAPDALQPIVNNLLSNALKFTPSGGHIQTDVDFHEGHVYISVADNGPGVEPEQLPHVFDRFFQAKGDATSQQGGFGIGLALVKELALKHGGDASVQHSDTGGCLFTVRLAGAPVSPEPIYEASAAKSDTTQPINSSALIDLPLVLVIEDQPELRRFIAGGLTEGYRIVEAADGADGLRLASELIPDVIVSDVMMPAMDGVTLCAALKNQDATSHIPTILLTALADPQDRLAGLDAGADDYLAKPFSMAELRLRVRNMIQSRTVLREKYASGRLSLSEIKNDISLRDREFLDRLSQTVLAQLADSQLGVDTLAQVACLSPSQLNRKLKALIDQTPAEFIRLIKLQCAMQMLQQGERVNDVAWATGFESPSYFAKVFKKHYGKSPSSV